MVTKLDKSLRRELVIDGEPWVVTIEPALLRLTRKGHRKGLELAWKDLVNGDAALAASLNAAFRFLPRSRSTVASSPRRSAPRASRRKAKKSR